ncbi:MAG TPA: LPS export ABC transporter permease LptF [Gammaproteobacteria bacterium]|nr:LPS export ABC transporter permease LptF [Gammaproteobacteria bacterium]
MTRITDRYIVKETVLTMAAVTTVLMLILLSNRFALLLGDAAAGRLPRDTVFTLLALQSVNLFVVIVPVALFLGMMLALGRLYRDSEMTTLMACGVGPAQIYRPMLFIGCVVALAMATLSLQAAPWAARMTHIINSAAQHNAEVGSFESAHFKVDQNGRGSLYSEQVSSDGRQLQNIFLEGPSDKRMAIITAASGHRQGEDDDPAGSTLILNDGYRYEGVPGDADFHIVHFAEHGIVIQPARPDSGAGFYETYSTPQLLLTPGLGALSEMQWRLSVPLSVLLLTILAVPLARTSPRQGRYGKLLIAILAYVIYSNLVGVARAWLERSVTPPSLGTWWVDLIFLGVAVALLLAQYGWRGLFGFTPRVPA